VLTLVVVRPAKPASPFATVRVPRPSDDFECGTYPKILSDCVLAFAFLGEN
jgi:hypothetical protein